MLKTLAVALGATLLAGASAQAADISGAGATFPAPVYAKWAESYKAQTGVGLNYQAIGSGGGIKQIKAKTVAFGASDKPLKPAELSEAGLMQFPTVMGGVVPIVNLPGVLPGQLHLNGVVLADIYRGALTKWNAPQIAALNKGVKLPNLPITVVHRSDGSGTTFLFTSYLSMKSPTWQSSVGASDSVQWPVGLGGKGNDGVSAFVKQTIGSIGYVEYAYAKQNKLTHTKMINKAGKTVSPTAETFQAAAASADWKSQPGYGVILANQPGDQSWPMTAATWILIYKKPTTDPAITAEALKFFAWS
ncbi:MAG: phosphate ABC transporter substrate-binding protein PstS, partial [Pseudomonadota bacterium]